MVVDLVMLSKILAPGKVLAPEKVLLSARRVVEAVESVGVAQPKAPEEHCTKEPPVQVERPKPLMLVPKRLVVEAVVLKRLVEVALVVVERVMLSKM